MSSRWFAALSGFFSLSGAICPSLPLRGLGKLVSYYFITPIPLSFSEGALYLRVGRRPPSTSSTGLV
ncbi:hypothetical protein E2C01_008836 [Portunus trituberculatus]|uniref:Secreted protein n=1 Tax=Portunus trituberculatus TaxID=210409 RepID=A0A5B7D3E7_PORTR|nr:hypothetical protein [Portunus trituberculatus]